MSDYVELSTHIGGFSDELAETLPRFFHETRQREFYREIFEQSGRASQMIRAVCDSVGDPAKGARRGILFEESLANQVIHGHPTLDLQRRKSQVRLSVSRMVEGTNLRVQYILSLDDQTPTFEPEAVPDPTQGVNLEAPTGRGLLMISGVGHATMQQIPRSGGGKTVVYTWSEEFDPNAKKEEKAPEGTE